MELPYFVIFEATHIRPCSDRALVLQSQGIKSETMPSDHGYQLLVLESDLQQARLELVAYDQENQHWPPVSKPPTVKLLNPLPGLIGYMVTILFIAWAAGKGLGDTNWFSPGKLNAGQVLDGQWWLTFTALTLHADIEHLLGNLLFGVVFGYFAGQYFGSGVAWLTILLAGAAGNWLNSFMQASWHTSVGASTAIFASLGLIAAYSWKRKLYPQDRWAYRLGPIVGGIALLAFTGTGGERTDVGAHFAGFICGIVFGILYATWPHLVATGKTQQWLSGLATVGLLALSWAMALS